MRKRSKNYGFIMRPVEMLQSPAFRALSPSGHRVLFRAEIEHAKHHGKVADLIIPHTDYRAYGVHQNGVALALREVDALGFAIVKFGRGGNAAYRQANTIRLTYLRSDGVEPTHDRRKIPTIEQAQEIAEMARTQKRKNYRLARKPQSLKPRLKNRNPVTKTMTGDPSFQSLKPRLEAPNSQSLKPRLLSRLSTHLPCTEEQKSTDSGRRTGPANGLDPATGKLVWWAPTVVEIANTNEGQAILAAQAAKGRVRR
jgi:hypothetical protein